MGFSSKTFGLYLSCAVIGVSSNFAFAGGSEPSEFENRYQPNQREICEMYASANRINEYSVCKSVALFEPTLVVDITDDPDFIAEINKDTFPDWPFREVYFQRKNRDGKERELVLNIEDLGSFPLGDIIHHSTPIQSVAIGNIDNVLVLEVRGGIYTQIIFSPYSCEGYEGYGDETYYGLSHVFRWWPNFANEMYEKTFSSPPLCN